MAPDTAVIIGLTTLLTLSVSINVAVHFVVKATRKRLIQLQRKARDANAHALEAGLAIQHIGEVIRIGDTTRQNTIQVLSNVRKTLKVYEDEQHRD